MKPNEEMPAETSSQARTKHKILLIDDERDFCKTIKLCLEKLGPYEVDTSFNAIEGLNKIQKARYEVILLDVLMPKVEGHEALVKIRALCDTPVIVLSAYISPMVQEQVVRQGAFACVRKPAEIDELALVMQRAFERRTS